MQITQDKKRNLFIKSYGCQMNEYDSERMTEILEKHNYSSVDEPTQADLIILNTSLQDAFSNLPLYLIKGVSSL